VVAIVLGVAGVAVVGYVLVSRWRGQVLNLRRLLLLPAVLTAVGAAQVAGVARQHGYRPVDLAWIAAGVLASAVLGVARGATVAVYDRNGAVWLRYRTATLWLWLATVAVRVGLTGLAHLAGARLAASGPALLLAVGTTLLGEAAMVARTAFPSQARRWQARTQRHAAASR
jgi:hypothetical protein